MKVAVSVSNCNQCPNRHYDTGGTYMCTKSGNAPLLKTEAIPPWCPLPDDARPMAARARKAVEDAKVVTAIAMTEANDPNISIARLRDLVSIISQQLQRG